MKVNKKIIITTAIVVIVAICGVIVYNTKTVPKMLVGGIYNGITLRSVTEHSDAYSEYDIHNALSVEKKIAENTTIIISSMTLTSDNSGKVTLRIISPDIKSALEEISIDVISTDKSDFCDNLANELLKMLNNNSITKRTEPVFIETDMKFDSSTWIIVPNNELYNAITGNINNIMDEIYNASLMS